MRIKNIVLVEISILSLRVDLKYLDRIHGSKWISLFPSRSFLFKLFS